MTINHDKYLVKFFAFGLLPLVLAMLPACQQIGQNGSSQPKSTSSEEQESRLILNNASLEQSNRQGQTLWKIKVDKAAYSPDRKDAKLTKIRGNIFQDGKIVLKISAQEGEIYKDGEDIFLKKNIIATDPRNGTTIRSEEVQWRPHENTLIVRKNLKGYHPQLEASATEGRYKTDLQRLELSGNILATAEKRQLQLKADHLIWTVPQHKLVSDRPLTIIRYQDKIITDRAVAARAEVRLKTHTVIIPQNIEYRSLKPPIQIVTDFLSWNYKNRTVESDKPVQVVQYEDRVTITGNQASVNLDKQIAHLSGGVQGFSSRNQAKLYATDLTWNIASKIVEATGNVVYEQTDPKFHLTGEHAIGILQQNSVVVSGNQKDRVVTEIYPN